MFRKTVLSDWRDNRRRQISVYGLALIFMFLCLFPILWVLVQSFVPVEDLFFREPRIIPNRLTVENYRELLLHTDYLTYFLNSLLIAIFATPLCVFISSLAAYSLTKYRYRFRNRILDMILFTYMFPPIVMSIPLYLVFLKLNLINTRLSLILVYVGLATPFAIWLLSSFFRNIPDALLEAAKVDGASGLQIFRYVVWPLAKPGLIATSIFVFSIAYTEYLYASIFVSNKNLKTIPIGLSGFVEQLYVHWGLVLAGVVLTTLPIVAIFAFGQRYLVEGLFSGALKG